MRSTVIIQKLSDFFYIFSSSNEWSSHIGNPRLNSKQNISLILFNKRWKFNLHSWKIKMPSWTNLYISTNLNSDMIIKNLNYFSHCSSRIHDNLVSNWQISNNIWIITINIRILTQFSLININIEDISLFKLKWCFSNPCSNIWSFSIKQNTYLSSSSSIEFCDSSNQILWGFRSCMCKVNSHNIHTCIIEFNHFFKFIIISNCCDNFC